MKHLTYISSILLAAAVFADPADPQISNVRLNQNSISRRVTVQYDLDEAAVVTMDVLTNGVTIGMQHVRTVAGDVSLRGMDVLARGEGADVMCPFVNSALSLRRTLRENRP